VTAKLTPEQADLEEYFLRSGLPHLAVDYDPREDTLTRLRPALLVLFLTGLGIALRPDWPWWARGLAVLAGLGIALGGLVALNVLRGRRATARPERVGFVEAAVFVLAPAAAEIATGSVGLRALWIALISIGAAAVLYVLTSLGVVSLLLHLGRAAFVGLRATGGVALRALPPVLAVLLFLFLATEVWQAFGLIEGWRFGSVLTLFALTGTGFLAVALARERRELCAPNLDDNTARLAIHTPARALVEAGVRPLTPPLPRMARLNITVALVVSLGIRVVAVGAAVALFFMLFGVLVVDKALTADWLGQAPHVLVGVDVSGGREMVLTEQLVRVSVLLGGFAALYFLVVALTEKGRREDFLDDEIDRLSRVMAAWAYYRGSLARPQEPPEEKA
jgi:hypothetical protein